MQIIQWLIKIATEPLKETHQYTPPPIKKDIREDKVKLKDIVEFSKRGVRRSRKGLRKTETSELNCNNLNLFKILTKRDITKICFHNTISLRRLGSFRRRQHWKIMKMKKDNLGHQNSHEKVECCVQGHVGNTKVLPISDASVSARMESQDHRDSLDKKEKSKGDNKTLSRMKELLRWAAATRSDKGGKYLGRKVLQFRNRAAPKAAGDDGQFSNESPKISFRWDVDSCSTTSTVYSALSTASAITNDHPVNNPSMNSTPAQYPDHHVPRKLNWITSDSEFVVLEL